MSDTAGKPQDQAPDGSTPPAKDADKKESVDFDAYTKTSEGNGLPYEVPVSEPPSGGSVISWAELLKNQPRPQSEDEVLLGSLPDLQIDANSDNEIIKSLQKEAGKSGVLQKIGSKSSHLIKKPEADKSEKPSVKPPVKPGPEKTPLAAKVFAGKPTGSQVWRPGANDGDSKVDLMTAGRDATKPLSGPGSGKRTDESSDVLAAAIHADDGTSEVNLGSEPRNTSLNSWGVPNAAPALVQPKPKPIPPPRPVTPSRNQQTLSSWLGGAAAGVAATALVYGGLWFGGILPRTKSSAPATQTTIVAAKSTPDQARRYLESGEPELALDAFGQCEQSSAVLAGRGQARWLNYLRQQKRQRSPLAENDTEVVAARKELLDSKSPEGALWLGLINESFGRLDAAREAYDVGRDNYPNRARLFAAAHARLDALVHAKRVAIKIDPQLGLALVLTLAEMPAEAGGVTDEAGYDFWTAVNLARMGDFSAGRAALLKARAAHEQRRDLVVRKGQNPDSDPREEIFLHSCDQMLAWWDVQAKLQAAGYSGQSPSQTIDALLANQKKFDEAMKALAATLKVQRLEDVTTAVETITTQRQQAIDRWKKADEALAAAKTDLGKKGEELSAARKAAATELQQALAREAEARKALEEVAAARRKAEQSYSAIHARLLKAKLIGEQAEPDELVKALDVLLSADVNAKDAEIARLRGLLNEARRVPNVPVPAPAKADPELAERLFSYGLQLYYAGKYAEAEQQLVAAQLSNDRDARILYFLGLSRLPQGKNAAADTDFRRAVELERRKLPESSEVSAALERIQGPDRQIINRYRR